MNYSCFYYPRNKEDLKLNQNFILGRIEKYEKIKKRIEKVYKKKSKLSLSYSSIKTMGKVMKLEEKNKVLYKDKRTSVDSVINELSEKKISKVLYPRIYK